MRITEVVLEGVKRRVNGFVKRIQRFKLAASLEGWRDIVKERSPTPSTNPLFLFV